MQLIGQRAGPFLARFVGKASIVPARFVRKVGKSDLWLDHPELGEVATGIGILRAERRAKCIDLGEREAVRLDIKLPRHRQECFTAKKILHEIDLALRRARQVGEVQRRYPE